MAVAALRRLGSPASARAAAYRPRPRHLVIDRLVVIRLVVVLVEEGIPLEVVALRGVPVGRREERPLPSPSRPSVPSRKGLYSSPKPAGSSPPASASAAARRSASRRAAMFAGAPGASGDQLADDDVLLEADEAVLGAVDGGLGEDAGRLLEGRRREEAARVQRGLGHAQQHRHGRRRLATLGEDALVELLVLEAVDELERAAARCRRAGRCAPCGASAAR